MKFRVLTGEYAGKDVTLKGTPKSQILNKDIRDKTKYTIEATLSTAPNKYNSITFYIDDDSKSIDTTGIDKKPKKWKEILLSRLSLGKKGIEDMFGQMSGNAPLKKDQGNLTFIDKFKSMYPQLNTETYPISEFFDTDKSSLGNLFQELYGYSGAKTSGLVDRFLEATDMIRQMTNMDYEINHRRGYQLTDSQLEKMFTTYSSTSAALTHVDEDFYSMMEVKGFSLATVDKMYLSNPNNNAADVTRIKSIITTTLRAAFQDHRTWVDPNDLFKTMIQSTMDQVITEQEAAEARKNIKINFLKALKDLTDEKKIVLIQTKDDNENRVVLKEIFDFERQINTKIFDISTDKHIQNSFDSELVDECIDESEKKQGFKFTDQQIEVIKSTLGSGITSINGYAGTGKSSIVRALNMIFQKSGMLVSQVAFTGRASDSLAKSSGAPAQTVHSALGIRNDDDVEKIFREFSKLGGQYVDDINEKFNGTQERPKTFPSLPMVSSNVIIVDEYPTLSIILLAGLLYSAAENHQKVILIGDSGQLPAINYSSDQAINYSPFIKHFNLSAIKRQDNASKIIEHSLDVREGKVPEEVEQRMKDNERLITIGDINYDNVLEKQVAQDEAIGIFRTLYNSGEKLEDIVCLSPYNRTNKIINHQVQKMIANQQGDSFMIGEDHATKVFDQELVINTKNQDIRTPEDGEAIRIYNGNIGRIVKIDTLSRSNGQSERYMDVDFGPLGIARFIEDEKSSTALDLAYAITTHKAQGSTIKNVIGIFIEEGQKGTALSSRQMLYTMMTRPSDDLYMITNLKALKDGINNNINVNSKSDFDILYDSSKIAKINGI